MKKEIEVPFDKEGNQITYARKDSWQVRDGLVTFKPNFIFKADLRYEGFSRGRSALNIIWRDQTTGKTYMSGMSLLDSVLSGKSNIARGFEEDDDPSELYLFGDFTFKKQGTSVLLIEHIEK